MHLLPGSLSKYNIVSNDILILYGHMKVNEINFIKHALSVLLDSMRVDKIISEYAFLFIFF